MLQQVEVRKRACPACSNRFWVDCDDTDYPVFCPFCGEEPKDGFIIEQKTATVEENQEETESV